MMKNTLRIFGLFLVVAGIADALGNHDFFFKRHFKDYNWYSHHNPDYLHWEDVYDNPFDLIHNHRLSLTDYVKMFNDADYLQSLSNNQVKADKTTARKLVTNIPSTSNSVSNEVSNAIFAKGAAQMLSSSEPTSREIEGEHSTAYDNQNINMNSSGVNTETSNTTMQSDMQERSNRTSVLERNSTEPDEIQSTYNQSQISDINAIFVPINSSKNDLDHSVENETSDFNSTAMTGTSSVDYVSTSTGYDETTASGRIRISESKISDRSTISEKEATSTDGVTSTIFDFNAERARKATSFEVKSTTLENVASESTDRQKVASESPLKSTEDSASSTFNTSPDPSVSYRATGEITNRRYSVSDSQTGTQSSTELPENNLLAQPEQVIEVQSIRTLKIVVSVVFMGIAFVAGTVLIVFIFKVKRQEVQYDQLTLIP